MIILPPPEKFSNSQNGYIGSTTGTQQQILHQQTTNAPVITYNNVYRGSAVANNAVLCGDGLLVKINSNGMAKKPSNSGSIKAGGEAEMEIRAWLLEQANGRPSAPSPTVLHWLDCTRNMVPFFPLSPASSPQAVVPRYSSGGETIPVPAQKEDEGSRAETLREPATASDFPLEVSQIDEEPPSYEDLVSANEVGAQENILMDEPHLI